MGLSSLRHPGTEPDMTAPFAPPPPWEVKAVLLGMLVVAVAIPFAGREGWIGGTASLGVAGPHVLELHVHAYVLP